LCIKLEPINELYYDARPNKSQKKCGAVNILTIDDGYEEEQY